MFFAFAVAITFNLESSEHHFFFRDLAENSLRNRERSSIFLQEVFPLLRREVESNQQFFSIRKFSGCVSILVLVSLSSGPRRGNYFPDVMQNSAVALGDPGLYHFVKVSAIYNAYGGECCHLAQLELLISTAAAYHTNRTTEIMSRVAYKISSDVVSPKKIYWSRITTI